MYRSKRLKLLHRQRLVGEQPRDRGERGVRPFAVQELRPLGDDFVGVQFVDSRQGEQHFAGGRTDVDAGGQLTPLLRRRLVQHFAKQVDLLRLVGQGRPEAERDLR